MPGKRGLEQSQSNFLGTSVGGSSVRKPTPEASARCGPLGGWWWPASSLRSVNLGKLLCVCVCVSFFKWKFTTLAQVSETDRYVCKLPPPWRSLRSIFFWTSTEFLASTGDIPLRTSTLERLPFGSRRWYPSPATRPRWMLVGEGSLRWDRGAGCMSLCDICCDYLGSPSAPSGPYLLSCLLETV